MAEKKKGNELRKITIYGLISFFGTERAKKCAMYLHKALPFLYKRPTVRTYYDHEWVGVVKELQDKYSDRYRKLKYLKHPVIVFFGDQYIGDHRAIIHYTIMEHRILPDLPFPNLFPDFTDFLPKSKYKDYVYLDVRVGSLDDYVVGKMVFELHSDLVPKTCAFFLDLCKSFHERKYGTKGLQWKFSYLGSTIRRVCSNSFVQGGKIEGCSLHVKDENYIVKHSSRGVLSLCNEGDNNSTTEFCISLKENKWLDNKLVAFGQMIFGEPILTAIQEVPTYYERPLTEIIMVGCGVIPSCKERKNFQFNYIIEQEKELINKEIEELRNIRMEEVKEFAEKVKSLLHLSDTEKSIEYVYYEDVKFKQGEELGESIGEGEGEQEVGSINESEEVITVKKTDFTLKEFMKSKKLKDRAFLTEKMGEFIDGIIESINFTSETDIFDPLDELPKLTIGDAVEPREVASGELLQKRFEAGLYSIPESLRASLVKAFNNLTPSQLKLIGLESRRMLSEAGASEASLGLVGSEGVVSGLALAVANVSFFVKSDMSELLSEIYEDVLRLVGGRGEELVASMLAARPSHHYIDPESSN